MRKIVNAILVILLFVFGYLAQEARADEFYGRYDEAVMSDPRVINFTMDDREKDLMFGGITEMIYIGDYYMVEVLWNGDTYGNDHGIAFLCRQEPDPNKNWPVLDITPYGKQEEIEKAVNCYVRGLLWVIPDV